MTNRPNLFEYATSELSNDAILCWMAKWAESSVAHIDPLLHQLGRGFLSTLLGKHCVDLPSTVSVVEVSRQFHHIDVLLVIDGSLCVCIEDKVGTQEHSNQLARYLESLRNSKYAAASILPIYLQIAEQSSYHAVEQQSFKVVGRTDLLSTLDAYYTAGGTSDIALGYRAYLWSIEDGFRGFWTTPFEQWGWWNWVGFYSKVKEYLPDSSWGYVPNASGGFLGLWWHWLDDQGFQWYLQLQQKQLVVKVNVDDNANRGTVRDACLKKLLIVSREMNLAFARPKRLGLGQTMTIGEFQDEYRQKDPTGRLDFDKTLKTLEIAMRLVDRCRGSAQQTA